MRQKWTRLVVLAMLAFIAVLVGRYVLSEYQGAFKKWFIYGIAIPFLLPLIIWEIAFPLPVALSSKGETVDYEFRDKEYAIEFARLNNSKTNDELY